MTVALMKKNWRKIGKLLLPFTMRADADSLQDSTPGCRNLRHCCPFTVKLWECCQFFAKRVIRQISVGEKNVEGFQVRHFFLGASSKVLLILVVRALSNAQTAKPDNGLSVATGADVFRTLVADGFQTQDYLSKSGKEAIDGPPPGYISGTILDQSGAV